MNVPEVDRAEVYRYLGYRGQTPDSETAALIDRCIEELRFAAEPRSVIKTYPLEIDNEKTPGELRFAGECFTSDKLARHLKGCTEVAVFAATLGLAVDRLIAKKQMTDIAGAAITDAAAAALIEAVCDEVNRDITAGACALGMATRSRFSPGYGDLALDVQDTILAILDAGKRCGITLTAGGMMMPTKSVTALVGIGADRDEEEQKSCASCEKTDCAFRKVSKEE